MKTGFIDKLLDATAFPHSVDKLELIETHISWVILTGDFAYKIKRPVDLGFVDFTSLARRKHFCNEELRLNQRTAPQLYLKVVPIAESAEGLRVGQEPAIEYAVQMRQFPADARLDRQLESGRLGTADVMSMATVIASFHQSLIPKLLEDPTPQVTQTIQFALDNFDQIKLLLDGNGPRQLLSKIEAWTLKQLEYLRPTFENRVRGGFVREGHGDLHLANMVKLADRIVLFDCLEFDPKLRWLDLMNDTAFLVMDLMAHQRKDLAFILLNTYLKQTGDYTGISVLRFYLVYRCLVRAKVAAMQPKGDPVIEADIRSNKTRLYLELAQSIAQRSKRPRLLLMHGFSGVGKSWLCDRLTGALGAIVVSSDLERKRLHGLSQDENSASAIDAGLYDASTTEQTYACLESYSEIGLQAGFTMIADASFLSQKPRQRFMDLAGQLQVEVLILNCTAPLKTMRERILTRAADPQHVSEANLAVLDHQQAHHDPFTDNELQYVYQVPMGRDFDFHGLLAQLGEA